MKDHHHTDAELAFWIKKYLLFQGMHSFTSIVIVGGGGLTQLLAAAASKDLIGWTEFLHGKVSTDIDTIQQVNCTLSPCQIIGLDWMKLFLLHLLQISHSQWIFRKFTLHDKQWGYCQLKQRMDMLREVNSL
jgi:hypothetical protein